MKSSHTDCFQHMILGLITCFSWTVFGQKWVTLHQNMAAVENITHSKTAFLTLPKWIWSVVVFTFLLGCTVTYNYFSRRRSVGFCKVRLELTPEDKTVAFKVNEWRLYSWIICQSYQRLQCMFLKRYRRRKTVELSPWTGWPPTTSLQDDWHILYMIKIEGTDVEIEENTVDSDFLMWSKRELSWSTQPVVFGYLCWIYSKSVYIHST